MDDRFFSEPILNSPYAYPGEHWELDERGQPTGTVVEGRRKASFVTPIPTAKKQSQAQAVLPLDADRPGDDQQYLLASTINDRRVSSSATRTSWARTIRTARSRRR